MVLVDAVPEDMVRAEQGQPEGTYSHELIIIFFFISKTDVVVRITTLIFYNYKANFIP